MPTFLKPIAIVLFSCLSNVFLLAQNEERTNGNLRGNTTTDISKVKFFSLEPAPTFNKKRFWISAGTGTAIYSGVSVALWHAWYKGYPLGKFHTFNDMPEWRGMDKSGHLFSAWMEANLVFQGARWTGMNRRRAMWTGVGVGMGLQATVEIMDGFSQKWGFSWGDIAFNTLGATAFAAQEIAWQEQRITFKVSGSRPDYPTAPITSTDGGQQTTLDERAAELYGTLPHEVILKDYNALTVWASVNVGSFLPAENRFPKWLNLALGYGAANLYGGFENQWENEDGAEFSLDESNFPRFSQFYLSPDIDLTKIPTRHRWLKATFRILNLFKLPGPAIEANTHDGWHFHLFQW